MYYAYRTQLFAAMSPVIAQVAINKQTIELEVLVAQFIKFDELIAGFFLTCS
jgi:hypothetical protein